MRNNDHKIKIRQNIQTNGDGVVRNFRSDKISKQPKSRHLAELFVVIGHKLN